MLKFTSHFALQEAFLQDYHVQDQFPNAQQEKQPNFSSRFPRQTIISQDWHELRELEITFHVHLPTRSTMLISRYFSKINFLIAKKRSFEKVIN